MHDLALFSIAAQRTRWLATRGAVLASNIANADTPGYKARDVVPFDTALSTAGSQMSKTSSLHLLPAEVGGRAFESAPRPAASGKYSGNTVSLDTELMTLGEVRSQHSMVSGVVGSFHRMLLSVLKG